MNFERIEGISRQIAGRINEAWGEFSGNALRAAEGRRAQIAGASLERHGYAREQSARQLREFVRRNRNWTF